MTPPRFWLCFCSQGSALLKQLDALITLLQVGKSWANWVNWMKQNSFVHGEAAYEARLDLFFSECSALDTGIHGPVFWAEVIEHAVRIAGKEETQALILYDCRDYIII